MSVENPGGKRWWRGGYVCECVTLIVPVMERRMIEAGVMQECFDFFQYGYNADGVAASAGTHDGGGVWDSAQDSTTQIRIQRECGGAAWARTPAEGFDYHNHTVLCGCPHASQGAKDQVQDYKNGKNGLANNGPDTGPDVPYITWQDAYYKYEGKPGEGVVGLTDTDSWSRSIDQNIAKDSEWHLLKIDDDDNLSLATGPMNWIAFCGFTVGGLAPGQSLQVRFQRVFDYSDNRATTVEASYPIKEIHGTGGDAFDILTWGQWIGDNAPSGAKEKIRIYAAAPDVACVIKHITTRCMHD